MTDVAEALREMFGPSISGEHANYAVKCMQHSVWLSEHVPGARLHLLEGVDHVSIILRVDTILDDLLDLAGLQGQEGSTTASA